MGQERTETALRSKLRIRGMRQRWIIGSVVPVALILLMIAVFSAAMLTSSYYSNAQSVLENKARSGTAYFNTYAMNTYSEYYRTAVLYAGNFDAADRIELQFLNRSGRIEVSNRSMATGVNPSTPEIRRTLESGKPEAYMGRDPATGQRIMAVSAPLKVGGTVVGVMRYVTAVDRIDHQVMVVVIGIMLLALAIIGVILATNLIFIRNVVAPVAEVTEAARRISDGSYGIQIPNKYDDEMGQLVDNINDMSMKISQSEKMQTEFISSVSHELRTPLTAINGWGETLLADESGDLTQLRRGIRIILKESRRLTNMVEELLEFSKIEDGRCKWSRWTCRRNLKTPSIPIGSCSGRTASSWSI